MTGGPRGRLLSHLALQDATNKSSEITADAGQRGGRRGGPRRRPPLNLHFYCRCPFGFLCPGGGERKAEQRAALVLKRTADWFGDHKAEKQKKRVALGGAGEADVWQLQNVTLQTNSIVQVLLLF